ncbi:hypothetical protein C2S51_023322 [Perilla frutescens var. frutescens]|nr:hypothetical protein C2S51_023322 [Perilla frutescens var. frutescens]
MKRLILVREMANQKVKWANISGKRRANICIIESGKDAKRRSLYFDFLGTPNFLLCRRRMHFINNSVSIGLSTHEKKAFIQYFYEWKWVATKGLYRMLQMETSGD